MINLPTYIQKSVVLSDSEKELLGSVSQLPSPSEIDEIRTITVIQELLNAFIGDESTRDTHLQMKAKDYLFDGQVDMAWRVLLL